MKKRTLIALMLIGALALSSCSNMPEETEETTTETTAVTTVETTAAPTPTRRPTPFPTSTPTPIPSPSPTPRPTITPPPPEPEADPIDADEDQYAIIMAQIDTIEAEHEGSFYQIQKVFHRNLDIDYWVLTAYYEDTSHKYVIKDGEIMEFDESSDEPWVMLPYDEITSIPFLVDTSNSWYFEMSEMVDSIEDGRYFGEVIGFSEDGTRMWLCIGKPIILEQSFVESLEVGDSIGVTIDGEELTIAEIYESGDGTPSVTLSNGWYMYSYSYCEDPDTELIAMRDDNPCFYDRVIVEVPVSSSCTLTDTYATLGTIEGYDEIELTGNPILDSYWWYFQSNVIYSQVYSSNGWYYCHGLAYPVVISGGEVVSINVEWR